MRPRLGRLKARPEFLQVAAAGRKWSTPGLVLQAGQRRTEPPRTERPEAGQSGVGQPGIGQSETGRRDPAPSEPMVSPEHDGDPEQAPIRVGFTASRKVGSAVARNRAKRRLRALAAELLPSRGKPGTDYVLIGRSATVTRPFPLLRQDLEQALEAVERRRAKPRSGAARRGRKSEERAR